MEKQIENNMLKEDASGSQTPPSPVSPEKSIIPVPDKAFRIIPPALQEVLGLVIKMTAPEKVFLTGIYENDGSDETVTYDLIIVIPGSANLPYSEYDMIIKHISMRVYPVTATILKRNDLFKKLLSGHIYFSRVCHPENLLFDDGRSPCLPLPKTIPVEDIIALSEKDFNIGLHRSQSFWEGACYYSIRKETELAAFMLHQSVELTYRAVLKSLTGHEPFSHDLRALMHKCRRCTPGLSRIFPADNEDEKRLLLLLQKAYVNCRYKNNYKISNDDLMILLSRSNQLHITARHIFRIKIKEAEKALYPQ